MGGMQTTTPCPGGTICGEQFEAKHQEPFEAGNS
jgi:hypothetical protein